MEATKETRTEEIRGRWVSFFFWTQTTRHLLSWNHPYLKQLFKRCAMPKGRIPSLGHCQQGPETYKADLGLGLG
jgi:hypothetical protein